MAAPFASSAVLRTTRVALVVALLAFAASTTSAADRTKHDLFIDVQEQGFSTHSLRCLMTSGLALEPTCRSH